MAALTPVEAAGHDQPGPAPTMVRRRRAASTPLPHVAFDRGTSVAGAKYDPPARFRRPSPYSGNRRTHLRSTESEFGEETHDGIPTLAGEGTNDGSNR